MRDDYDVSREPTSSSGLWIGLAAAAGLLLVCGGAGLFGLLFSWRTAEAMRMEAEAEEAQRLAEDAAEDGEAEMTGEVQDENGHRHRLVLRFDADGQPADGKRHDFDSLTWERKEGPRWVAQAAISRAEFQKGAPRRRWVSRVESFDPRTRRAVLQVGEEAPPDGAGAARLAYSWREWDVPNNREVRVIRICQDPSEPFEKRKGGG